MKDWSKEIYNGNEGQGYIREYFEWQSKELGFYPKDGGGLLVGVLGTGRREVGAEGTGASLPASLRAPIPPVPPHTHLQGLIAMVQV